MKDGVADRYCGSLLRVGAIVGFDSCCCYCSCLLLLLAPQPPPPRPPRATTGGGCVIMCLAPSFVVTMVGIKIVCFSKLFEIEIVKNI